ncbi:hypothetical protein GE061_004388 [Apolygus lucorum]|uniref:Protein kinase domain-containing protein n=1 Tax=Apolygus lucorum TaxID=248454 RepID=A0A8S9WZ16_APOLU|nr:hypothetical protein GE061_004388 [Apolygus lucorum]
MSRYSELNQKDLEDLRYFGYYIYSKIGQGTFSKVYHASFKPEMAPSTANFTQRLRRTSSIRQSINFLAVMKQPVEKLACKVTEKSYRMPKDYPRRFLQTELNIITKLQHPYIPVLHSILRKGPKFIIFMTLAERGNLCDYVVQYGPVREGVAQRWTRQLVLALIYLHTMGIAHRDISCDNVLVTDHYNVKLADFGFSCFHHGPKYLHTHCGSMPYVAPEVIRGSPYNPKYSDIWSLGVVLFIMLNGTFPFVAHSYELQYPDQMEKNYSFKQQLKSLISSAAVKKVSEMLEPNPLMRISLQEILESPWLAAVTANVPAHVLKYEKIAQQHAQDTKEGMELMHNKTKKYSIMYPWIRIEKETYCERMSNLMKRHRMKRKNRMTFGEEIHFHFKSSKYLTVSDPSVSEDNRPKSTDSYRPPSSSRVAATTSHSALTIISAAGKSAVVSRCPSKSFTVSNDTGPIQDKTPSNSPDPNNKKCCVM